MDDLWKWTNDNSDALGVVIALILPLLGGLWVLFQFVLGKISEASQRRFETYHRLIKELVDPGTEASSMYADRQVAVIFELRHFPKYFPVTKRILAGLKSTWSSSQSAAVKRVLHEIDLTTRHIDQEPLLIRAAPILGILGSAIGLVYAIVTIISWRTG